MSSREYHPGDKSIEAQAERRLEATRKQEIRKKLFENLAAFSFEAEHIERRRGDEDWTCRLTAAGPRGEVVRGLWLTVKTPSALDFGRTYPFDLISFCPLWVHYSSREGYYTFSSNTKKTLGLDG
ncbi:MAG: hypothetical protein ABL984_00260 [Pyrinomonadaceae bacterium]